MAISGLVYTHGASYGSQLLNLKYRNEHAHGGKLACAMRDAQTTRLQRGMHVVAHVCVPYAAARLRRHAWRLCETWRRALHGVEAAWGLACVLNLMVFLYDGRYRSVVDRVLGMRLVYGTRDAGRQVSFEFMNRQLVWHAFTEFMMYVIPLVNLSSLRTRIARTLQGNSGQAHGNLHGSVCAICFGRSGNVRTSYVHTPYKSGCGHVYCYYCVKSAMMADPSFPCPRCGEVITSIEKVV
ncbi:hypothetical protein SeMB42_g07209 [Synchytrium endobioticum]|uniref:RING-type E3 ubiquitin transferase (cysteine targeting) n=1 Tax=Synchytrium endobioticum TaxID=286115 RepID=A0A507CB06_9FUNG|nr:hypothetical protein SeMB42_g07209 [Synchytrium endobioticum]